MKTHHRNSNLFLKRSLLPIFGVLGFAVASFSSASAQTTNVFTENFDTYTAGNLVGQGGWTQTGTSAATPIQVVNPGGAGYATLGTSGQDAYEAFSSAASHTDGNSLSTSFSLTLSAAQTGGDYFAHLTPTAGTTSVFLERIFAKSTTGGYLLGIAPGDGTATVYGTTVINYNVLTSVNVIWNFVPGASNDTFNLNVNGSAYATTTWTSTSVLEPSSLVTFNLRQGTASSAPTVSLLDNVSVDLTSATVPEPTTMLGGALLLGAAGWSQRRRFCRAVA